MAEVVPFILAQRAADDQAKAARQSELAQLALPLEAGADTGNHVSMKDKLAAAVLRDKLRKEAVAASQLVVAAEVQRDVAAILSTWSPRIAELFDQIGQEQGLPDSVRQDVKLRLAQINSGESLHLHAMSPR